MATQGITIPIQAKVEGWQAELKRIQDEAKKINLGSSLGRDLERYLTTLEKQVNSMGKSLTQNFTSDAAIDRFGNKVEDIEERFQRIGQILSSIQLGDLNVDYVSSQLNPLIDQINLLQSQLNDELDVAWGDKIAGEATKIQKAFARIGKSEDDIKNLGREGTRSVLEEMVTSAVKQADEAAEKIKNLQHNIAEFKKAEQDWQPTAFAKETNIDSYVSSVISKDPTSYGFQPIINEQALKETKKKIEDSINEIKLSDTKKQEIKQYLDELVPTSSVETINKRMQNIRQVLGNTLGLSAFGLDAESFSGYLKQIINETDISVLDTSLNRIKERFIADGITEEDLNKFWGPFSDAIKNQDFDKAIEIVSTNLTDLQEEYKSGKDKIIVARQELEEALKQAQGDQFRAAWTRTFGEDALKELDALIEKYTQASDTAKKLNEVQKNLNQKTKGLVEQPQNTGEDIISGSSQRYQQLISEVQAYKAELADVQAKEQLLGKIQGVAQRWFSIYAAVRMVENAIKSVISTVTELDSTITEIAIVTDMGQNELWQQMPQYTALAQQYAASISGVYQVSQLYYQQGLETAEVMELTEQTLKMARISGLDYAQATDYMTNAIRSFKMEMSDAQSIVDVYSAIAAASATDTTELASAMSKTASSAQAVGSSFEDTTAMMAVMIEATRESAENIGSAMKSIISRYGEMTSDPSKLVDSEGEVMSLNRVDTALQTVGITIHDTEGKFRSFSDVIVELAEKWDTIDTNTQRYIATTMAGNRQQSRFLALVSSGDRLNELMTVADESEDASQLQYLKTLDSITAKTQQLQTSLQTLYTSTGVENWYKSLLDAANNILATFNKMPKVFNLPIAAIANFGIQFYNIASVVTTVVSMIKNDLVTQAQQVQGLITEKTREAAEEQIKITREKVQAQEQVEQEGAERRANIAAGNTTTGNTKTIFGKEVSTQTYSKLSLAAKAAGSALSLLTAGMSEANTTGRVIKGTLEGVAGALTSVGYAMSGNPFMAIVSGVMAAVNAINTIIETAEERAERLSKAAEEANNKRIQSSANYKDLKSELDQIKELEKTYNDSAEAKEEYYEHTKAIAEQYPVLVSAYDTEGNAILDLTKAYDLLHEKRGQSDKDAADAANKAYEQAKNAEDEAQKQYNQAAYRSMSKAFGVVYTTNENGEELGQKVLSENTTPSYLQPIIDNLQNPVGLNKLAQLLDDRIVEEQIPVGGLAEDFMIKARDSSSWADLYNNLIQEKYREQLQNAINDIDNSEVKDAYQWLYDQIINNLSEIGVIAEKGAYNTKQAAVETARQTQINYKTQSQFSNKRLEANFNGGAPVDYLDDFSAFGTIVNGYIDTQFQKAVKEAEKAEQEAPEWSDWWENSSEIDTYYTTILEAGQKLWASLSPDNQTKLNSLIASRSKYNSTQFEKILIEEFGLEKEDPILTELLKYYTTSFNLDKFNAAITKRQEARGNKQNQLDSAINQYQNILGNLGGDELAQVLNQYDKLETKINAGAISQFTGRNILQQYIESFEGQTEEVQALLTDLDIFSFTDIMDLVHRLEGEEFKGKGLNVDPAITALKQIAHLIPLNINTEAETLVAQVTKGLSDTENSIKHITKGMNYKTMTEEAQKLGLETKDFQLTAGKYTPNDYAKVVNSMMDDYNNQFTDLITETENRRTDVAKEIARIEQNVSREAGRSITIMPTASMLGITEDQFKIVQEDYNKYAGEAGEAAKDFVNWYFDSQIQTITNTSGQVKDYLTDVFAREALEGGQLEAFASLAFGKDNWEAMGLESQTAILDAISTGDISSLTAEQQAALKQYEALIISTYKDIQSSIANSMISAIGNGNGTITVTETNKAALKKIQDEHADWLTGDVAVGSQVTIAAENLLDSTQAFEQFIVDSFNTNADRIKALTEAHNNQYKNSSIGSFDKVLTTENFAYEDLLNYLVNTKNVDLTKDIAKIPTYMDDMGLAFNSVGKVIVTNYTAWIQELKWTANRLKTDPNASQEEKNAIQAKLDNAQHAQEQAIASGFDGILKDYSNISTGAVEALANALGVSYEYITSYLTSNKNGTYQLNTSKLPALLSTINGQVSQATIEAIEKSISSIGDTYLSNIKNATSYTTKGASSLADVEAFRQSYTDITGQVLDESAFQYNKLTQSFMLDPAAMQKYVDAQKEILIGMGYTVEFVNAYITDQTDKAIQASIELDSFLNADTNKSRNDEANKLFQQIQGLSNYQEISHFAIRTLYPEYGMGLQAAMADIEKESFKAIMTVLESGGQDAVNLLKQIKPNASSDELEAAFNSQINKLTDVLSQVSDLVAGEFVGTEGKLHDILARAGAVDNNGVVKAGFNMVEVYAAIYAEMSKTAGKTTAGLNDAYAKLLTAQDQTNIDITEALQNGNGMSYADFGNLLAKYDIKFEDYMTKHWDTVMRDGFGNIRITDWEGFAKNIFKTDNLDAIRNTNEYISAFKAYNDGLIELNKNTEEAITEEIQQITGAKAGDWLNLTELWTQYSKAFTESTDWHEYYNQGYGLDTARMMAEDAKVRNTQIFDNLNAELGQWGATFENGILKLGDNVNLLGIAQALESAAEQAGLELGNGLEEVKDTILDILGAYTEAITNGIKGGLDNFSAQDLRKKADNIGVTNLHFEKTIDGLKLSQQSAIELYQALSKIDAIQGNIVFQELSESLKESNENFATTSALLNRVKVLTEAIITGREKINGVDQEVSSARLKQYKAELEVAKEIVSVRSSEEDESFNFMDNEIPAGQNNPLNYAKNWASAIQSINDAYKVYNTKETGAGGIKRTKSGYMAYEDFYNIINEINNMAGIMKQPITIGKNLNGDAIQLEGDLTSASNAIMAGIETLTAVDTGEMMVNIGALGINLSKGGNELKSGIEDGIDAIADAQIEALDGTIAMLELIVAMESLGDVAGEDMVIELPDIVTDDKNLDKDGNRLSDKFEDWRSTFLAIGSKSLELAETITINGQKMTEWLGRAAAEWTTDDAAVLDALYQAAISTDWNKDKVGESLQQLLNSGKFGEIADGFTITVDDITYTISNGIVVKAVKWTDADAQNVLKQYMAEKGYGSEDDAKARAEITAIIQKYLNGEGASPELSVEEILKIRNNTLIQTDENGNDYIIGRNGKRYDRDSAGWKAMIEAEILSDQGIAVENKDIHYDLGHTTVTTTYGIKAQSSFTVSADADSGQVSWNLAEGDDLFKYVDHSQNYHSQQQLLTAIYNGLVKAKKEGKDGSSKAAEILGKATNQEEFINLHYGIHVAVQTEVYKDKKQIQDASSDKKFRNAANEILSETDDQIKKRVESDNKGKSTITLTDGYTIEVDTDDITVKDEVNADLVRAKINETLGLDEGLKDTIKSGVAEAFEQIPSALENIKTDSITALKDALNQTVDSAKLLNEELNKLNGSNTTPSGETTYTGEPAPGALLTPAEAYATQVNIDIAGAEAALFGVPNEGTSEIVDGKAEVFSVDISDAEVQLNGDEVKAIEGSSVTITNPITGVPSSLDPLDMTYLERDLGQQQVEQGTTITVTNAITAFLQEIVPELGDGAWPATIEIGNHTISTDSLVTVILEKLLPKDGTTGTSLGTITLASGKTVNINDVVTAYLKFIKADASQAAISNSFITLPDGVTLSVEQAHAIIKALILSLSEGVIQSAANNIDIPSDIYSDKTTTIHVKTNLKYSPSDEIPIDGNDLYTAIQNAVTESGAPGDLPFVDEIMSQLVYSGLEDPKIYDSVQAYVNKLSDMYNADFTSENFLGDFSSWLEQNKDIPPINIPIEPDVDDLEIEDFEEPVTISTELDSDALTDSATEVGQDTSNAIATGIESGEKNISNAVGSIRTHITELGDTATVILSTIKDLLAGLQQHVSITGDVEFTTPFGNINGKSGVRGENGKINITVEGQDQIQEVKDEASQPVKMIIDANSDAAKGALDELVATIESTHAEAPVSLSSQPNQIQSQIDSRTYTANVQLRSIGGLLAGSVAQVATGNIGLAKAKGTLMGELGPELVVSNGRYFVAGQNGAEMVNLADDAIVFNHLQTEQLLKNGMSSGRGKAVTSEKNAVAFATGNTGPAMASASSALAALKELRAMWQSLKSVSVSDLAGAGGGGGGGGGDKAVDPSIWIDTVERWYNLMQKIAKLEKEITHEETLRSKLESDWNANGNHYYASQKRALEAIRDQIDAQEQLNLSRQAYYDQRVEALKNQPFGKLIEFDNEGQMQFKSGAMEWLTDLAGFDSYGKANYTDEEKYNKLIAAGYGDYMKYSDGGEIKKDSDGDGEVTDDELQTFYGDATKAFWDRLDEYKEATQSLWDSIKEGEDSLLDLQADRNSLLEEIRDNQTEVEDQVLKAIEDLRQREIDALQDERDKLEESTQKYIDGLTDALNREQEMYQNQEDETNLNQQRRRLAILQRSGGSAEDIASLRSEIDSSERERYFNLQQQQIDAIQAASDLEIERMDSQIEIMTETLEYQKEYGLLWSNVYAVMQESSEKIVSFITHGNSEFWTSSELASQKAINEQLFAAQQWTSYRDDLAAAKDSIGENGVTAKDISENVQLMATMTREQMKDNDYRTFDEAMKKEFGNDYDKNGAYKDLFYSEYQEHGDLTKVTASARKKYSDDKKAAEATAAVTTTSTASGGGGNSNAATSGSSGGSNNNKGKTVTSEGWAAKGGKHRWVTFYSDGTSTETRQGNCDSNGAKKRVGDKTYYSCSVCGNLRGEVEKPVEQKPDWSATRNRLESKGISPNTGTAGSAATAKTLEQAAKTIVTNGMNAIGNFFKSISGNKKASGGYVNHGVYELGELGTETVLTASQTKVLRDNILSNRPNSLISLLRSYNENYDGINSPLTGITPVEDNSVTIERVEMTMEVKQIANDYDAKRAGEQALNEMMRIARKTGATNSIRR